MSLENTENIEKKKKLMDILEEELSALKLEKNGENIYANYNHSVDGEENADKENFSSSSDTTAELLEEIDNNQKEGEYKVSEDSNTIGENVVEEIQHPAKYQHEEKEITHREPIAVNLENEKSAEILESNMCENQQNKVIVNNAEKFIVPEDLAEKVRQRAESCFEDYNLFKNSFLLSHVQRNKKGYVSLKLVASLRKIKSLTRDPRVVEYSLRNSKVLEFNEESNRIRRIEPVPRTEDTSFGKTLMVFNLPLQNLSPDSLYEMFSKFGTVVSAGVYEIESPASDTYHQRCLFFHRKIASNIYGIVEFEKYEDVVKALKDEDSHLPKENEVEAVPLLPQIYQKLKKHLKFLRAYNPNPRRGYERYRPRNDYYTAKDEATSSGDSVRNEKHDRNSYMRGSYNYKRGYFRRPYRGRNSFIPSNTKSFTDDYVPREWNQPFRGVPKKWGESRHLRSNNSLNIDRQYPQRRKAGNGYMYNGVPV